MLTFSDVHVRTDGRDLLTEVTFAVPEGSRTALVGPNGTGKTTLLRIAAGLRTPDAGHITGPDPGLVRYVPQDPLGEVPGATRSWLVRRAGLGHLRSALDDAEAALASSVTRHRHADPATAYADALDAYGAAGGWDLEARLERAAADLGLPGDALDRPVSALSGGQRTRLGLAALVASPGALWLLDEPTNHLDAHGLDALRSLLCRPGATALIVSHDRALLDDVATAVVELDPFTRTATASGATWAEHVRQRQARHDAQVAAAEHATAEARRLTRAAQAATTSAARTTDRRPPRDGDKYSGHFLTQRAAGRAARTAKVLQRRIDALDQVEEPRERWDLRLDLDGADRGPDEVVRAEGLVVRRGDFVLGPLDLAVSRGERVWVDGANGSGKTLLVRALVGAIDADHGRVHRGPGVVIATLDQDGLGWTDGRSILRAFAAETGLDGSEARSLLAKLELGADDVAKPTRVLSPGERCRLAVGAAVARRANLLVVDEPSNHLDLDAVEALGSALAAYSGTILVITHDRALRAEVAPTRRIALDEGDVAADEPL